MAAQTWREVSAHRCKLGGLVSSERGGVVRCADEWVAGVRNHHDAVFYASASWRTAPLHQSSKRSEGFCGVCALGGNALCVCLLYTSDAADDLTRVDLGGRRIIKKKKKKK